MLDQFKKYIECFPTKLAKQQVGVAISGGVDSVVLAYLLKQSGITISLLHCNFQLRGIASNGDQAYVKRFAEQLHVPFITTEFNTIAYAEIHKTSIQIAARELRYQWFEKMAKLYNLDSIATAHHADDNLETFLINLSRGTGLEGLTGIPEVNGLFIRPLLNVSKTDLIAFAKQEHLNWREDASNSDTKYLRNQLRHLVIPNLKDTSPQFLSNTIKTITYLKQSQSIVTSYIANLKTQIISSDNDTEGIAYNVELLLKTPDLDIVLFELFKEFKFTSFGDIKQLLLAQTGAKVFSKTHVLLKNRNHLLLYSAKDYNLNEADVFLLNNVGDKVNTPSGTFIVSKGELDDALGQSIAVNGEEITFPLIVRKWQEGDYFYPIGMQGKKKLSKYFKDEKLSLFEKKNIWLICSQDNIMWVVGKRRDRRYSVTETTRDKIILTFVSNTK